MNWYRFLKYAQTAEAPPVDEPSSPANQPEQQKCQAAAVVVESQGRILLLKRGGTAPWYPGYWNLPGGTVDPGEQPEAAAVRECLEEAGFAPSGLQLINQTDVEGCDIYFYGSHVPYANVQITWENSEYAWISPADISKYPCVPGVANAVTAFAQSMNASRMASRRLFAISTQ